MKKQLPYITVIFIAFYLIPLLIKDTGSAMTILLILIPMICFISSFINGKKLGFNWLYLIIISILFIPTVYIFYNSSALIYLVIYLIVSLVGMYLGNMIKKLKREGDGL